jgi:adenylate cyclase
MLTALVSAAFFALFYVAGLLGPLEERIYDFFLRGRPEGERIDRVVFLDVDDEAIAYNGVYPWPRSVMAEGLLRLKEYGTAAVILDIEFIDKGPEGVDSIYLNRDMPVDFKNTFQEVMSDVSDLTGALGSGRIGPAEAERYGRELLDRIQVQGKELFQKAASVARDNDGYLARASALYGYTWGTLNLQKEALRGEQAERRLRAEERFSYPLEAAAGTEGGGYVDLLPPLPLFAESLRGAGFTNVHVDKDGVRRRIYLVQKVYDHWYLQLALAPLMEYLGRPALRLEKGRLILKGALVPGLSGGPRDIAIPLDSGGRMMLDWPKEDYRDSFTHISFAEFSYLEELESEIGQYLKALENSDMVFFVRFDESLSPAIGLLHRANGFLEGAEKARALALAERSEEAFAAYLDHRSRGMKLAGDFLALEAGEKIRKLAEGMGEAARKEADYIAAAAAYLETALGRYLETGARFRETLEGKFCLVGRVDTGSTDIGVNPFYGEYVNVGTHAVVLDTILRGSFITPFSPLRSAVFCFVLSLLLMLALGGLKPVPRAALGLGGPLVFGLLCFLVFRYTGVFTGPLGPVLSGLGAVMVRELNLYAASEKEKQFISRALSAYVSREVVEELAANPSLLQLGGSRRQMSVLFTDIQNFSTVSEQLDPEQVVQLLNIYLARMSGVIMKNGGTIDKYEGDAIMAFFGAPVRRDEHALLACRSAVEMKSLEEELNRELLEQGLLTEGVLGALKGKGSGIGSPAPVPLYTRIGINTGEMVVGNMGTSSKMNYTVMGNAVNLAARLEGVNKSYQTGGILISEYTRDGLGGEFICRNLGRVRVVGISAPVRIYEVLLPGNKSGEGETLAAWKEAVELYERRNFGEAEKLFGFAAARNEKDQVARHYLELCRNYIAAPPPGDWDGINNLTEK